ncbi:rod shape-determining protein MreC [Flavobacteriaceae bacterium LMO-SS05]
MQQIINFVIRNKSFLLFLLLFSLSLALTIQSHSYHKSKFISSTNFLSGSILNTSNNIKSYFNLKEQNKILVEENNQLKAILYNSKTISNKVTKADSLVHINFEFKTATVIKNSYSNTKNYLTLDKGSNYGIKQDLGVITSKGIVGIIDNTSQNYSRVISILNTKSRINAQLKASNHIGSLIWNTKSPEFVQLIDISKFAPISIGDTIITGGQSTIFPKGIPIGTINTFALDNNSDMYTISVKLFNDMTNIGHVYVITNMDAAEIKSLQTPVDE